MGGVCVTDPTTTSTQRIDKWLWHARFFKTRSLAAKVVQGGLRIDGEVTTKPARAVQPGQVLTFVAGNRTRVVRILGVAPRRGPAPEAKMLYEDLSDPASARTPRVGPRPTKKDRRDQDALKSR